MPTPPNPPRPPVTSNTPRSDRGDRPQRPDRGGGGDRPPRHDGERRPSQPGPLGHEPTGGLQQKFLLSLLVVVTVAFAAVLLPFYGALMWGAIIGLLFAPLFRWLERRFNGRSNLAAAAAMGLVLLIVVLPFMLIAASLAQEGAQLVQRVKAGQIDFGSYVQQVVAWLPQPIVDLLDRFGLGDAAAIQQRLVQGAGRIGQFFANQLLDLGQGTFNAMVSFFVALYIAFFMLRDGRGLARSIREAIPMRRADKAELATTFTTVVRATVKGNLVVALVQGVLGGIALAVLGINGALLLGAIMAFAALLPSVGAALIWAPVALYLLATGEVWQGVALIAFGTLVIGLIDNILRPLLVGKDTKLPDWLVLITTIGGMALCGLNGFVIGPVVAAMFVAVWGLIGKREQRNEARQNSGPDAAAQGETRP